MRRRHEMPFGAQVEGDEVRFRLWAPAAQRVELVLEDAQAPVALEALADGWFELRTRAAHPGSRYRYRIDGGQLVPDPASRAQADDVHGPSVVVDPEAFRWGYGGWRGRPWEEAVVYELHVGTFTPEGTFDGVRDRLDHVVDLGVTAIELMPVADFPGERGWGYDGVLPFAPDRTYGSPDDLKRLVDAAHARGLMVLLDVVYNHFGPEGNYLHLYAPQTFTDRFETPWGAAIDYARPQVRALAIHNALYWLEEFGFDGLRLDAVHAIVDDSDPHLLDELAATVRRRVGAHRLVHLVLENEHNEAHRLGRDANGEPSAYTAQWNDDVHHALHTLATGEDAAYYADFADRPLEHLARCLTQGFAYQGEAFRHRAGEGRGEPSAHLPPTAFVAFLQNHDQVGNRAFGERLSVLAPPPVVEALAAVLLLAPHPPMLWMGEEWGARDPFLFFCDFGDELADAVREGRRREFAAFPAFRDEAARERIPDPNAADTFLRSKLDWAAAATPEGRRALGLHRRLLALRRDRVVPHLRRVRPGAAEAVRYGAGGLKVVWPLDGGDDRMVLLANLGDDAAPGAPTPGAPPTVVVGHGDIAPRRGATLPPWSVAWYLPDAPAGA